MASQLRLGFISDRTYQLPFNCKLKFIPSPHKIINSFLNTKVLPVKFNKLKNLNNELEQEAFILEVYVKFLLMKSKSCFMVRCIFQPNNSAENEKILLLLKEIINKRWPEATVMLKTDEAYWKWEGYREFIYHVSCPEFIFVNDFIKLFTITWCYLKDEVLDVDTDNVYKSEYGIWNKINYPNETFLKPEIEWVHIYTWLN